MPHDLVFPDSAGHIVLDIEAARAASERSVRAVAPATLAGPAPAPAPDRPENAASTGGPRRDL